jgi:hypothetical protein
MGRDTVLDAGAGIHRDWKAFATPAMSILPDLRQMRSGSWATTRAKPGLAERIRFEGNRVEPSLTLRKTGSENNRCRFCFRHGKQNRHRAMPLPFNESDLVLRASAPPQPDRAP